MGCRARRGTEAGIDEVKDPSLAHLEPSRSRDDFVMSFIGENTVLLLGSGVSAFQPDGGAVSGLPTGREIVTAIITRLFPGKNDGKFEKLIERTPFEQILEHHPQPDQVRKALSEFFSINEFNAVHLAIAEEVKKKNVVGIVTTNYDLCIEGALSHVGADFHTIVDGREKTLPGMPLLKVHGSAGHPTSIVATLSDEFRLPDWKVETMRRIVDGRHCVILGYSGLDFDICPVLLSQSLGAQSIVWAEPSENPSVNLRAASAKKLVDHRKAAFDISLGQCALGKLRWNDGSAEPLVDAIFRDIAPADLHRWRFNLLNSLAHARYMKDVIADATADGSIDAAELDVWNSDVAEREGRYFDSIELLKRARSSLIRIDRRRVTTIEQMLIGRLYTSRYTLRFIRALLSHTVSLRWLRRQHRADFYYLCGLAATGAHKLMRDRRRARAHSIYRCRWSGLPEACRRRVFPRRQMGACLSLSGTASRSRRNT